MLLYRTLVTDALINEVEPLLRKLIQDAMMQGAEPDWYQAYGQTILSNYEDYDKLKKRISGLSSGAYSAIIDNLCDKR